ncbi:MAG TPA: hypothetical protein PL051_04815 [Candidatus Saccharibacteria bacterium]|nr:hypothetical protein [Candidatus Saccharibacteria bacterium]
MTVTIEKPLTADGSHDVLPPEQMAPLADELAALEVELEHVSTDEKAILLDEKQRLLEHLLGDRIGETVINEIVYLAQLYKDRATRRELDDGTVLHCWGTRDSDNQYLAYKYYVLTYPDGRVNYSVQETSPDGQKIFKLNDRGDYHVYDRAPLAAGITHFRPVEERPEAAEASMGELFGTSLVTAGIVRARSDEQNRAADLQAQGMLGGSETDRLLNEATDVRDAYIALEQLHADRDVPYSLANKAIIEAYARR